MFRQLLTIGTLIAALSLSQSKVFARSPVRTISVEQARGQQGDLPTILVWAGSGVNLNFLPTGERIQRVWLDDPSRITLDFDAPLCQNTQERDRNCTRSAASIIHLKRIHPLKWAGLPQAERTLLTVLTEGVQGRQLYQFQIAYGAGKPQYTTLEVRPKSAMAAPSANSINLRQVEQGLQVALQRKWVEPDAPVVNKVNQFLTRVRTGSDVTIAAQQTGISLALVHKLAGLGTR